MIFVEQDNNEPISFEYKIDYIIHAAGNAYPSAFNENPVDTIMGNIISTYNLLKFACEHGTKRFLYISSGEVYGQGEADLNDFEETYGGYVDPTSPRSCYPNSKRLAETLCASFVKQYGLNTVIVRPSHTYGPGYTEKDNRANVQFIEDVLHGRDIILKSAGNQMRSYCYIADCVSAILTVMMNGNSGEAYNSANSQSKATIADFAHILANETGKKVIYQKPTVNEIAERTPIEKQVLSAKKLENLGWSGKYSIEKGIKNTITILREIKADD